MSVPVTWLVFDLGETLVDETANWDRWADHLGISRFTFHAAMGAVIAAGRPHTDVFSYFRPEFDLDAETVRRDSTGLGWPRDDTDLYDDVIPTLRLLREQGYRLAVFANQPRSAEAFMARLPVDRVATSQRWGVAKPDPRFFEKIAETLAAAPGEIAYIGDRVDNDVLPAKQAGMFAVHLRRGPWGYLQGEWPSASQADMRIETLGQLSDALRRRQRDV